MRAEKLILKTDHQGILHGLPVLPPNQEVEVILLMAELTHSQPPKRRQPSPRLAYKGATLYGDDMEPALPANEWNMLSQTDDLSS